MKLLVFGFQLLFALFMVGIELGGINGTDIRTL
jgi:hypothetical protein